MAGWSAAYALATLPGVDAALVVALYWAGLCAGRVCAPAGAPAQRASSSPSVSPRACALAVAGIASASTWNALAVSVFAAGFALGPLAPTMHRGGRRSLPAAERPCDWRADIAGADRRGALPWITGRVAIAYGFRAAMLVPLAAAIALALSAGALRVRRALQTVEPTRSEPA